MAIKISESFKRLTSPGTNRRVIQLTEGPGFCYPLYYFIPSICSNRYVIHHKAEGGEVQLFRLDLTTGESRQLTYATYPHTHWYPWCYPSGRGVLDHRSVLNEAREEVIYFDGNKVRVVNILTLEDRLLFVLPEDRMAIGQNCVTPDGNWFVYIHADRERFDSSFDESRTYPGKRWVVTGTSLAAYHLDTGEHRSIVNLDSPLHHVNAYDNEHLVFCHPAIENGMLFTNLQGGWYSHLRTQDDNGGCVCHYTATKRGLMYEVLTSSQGGDGNTIGLYHPFTHRKYELRLPAYFGYTHTGFDEAGRLWFFENETKDVHDLHFLIAHDPDRGDRWMKLFGNWQTYGLEQKSHFHPRLTPDRNWILFTAGDPLTETNHLFLLDVADLADTAGIPDL